MTCLQQLDSPFKMALFWSYSVLWTLFFTSVHASERAGEPVYNTASTVLVTELVKIVLSVGFYVLHDGGVGQFIQAACSSASHLTWFAVPALLYCVRPRPNRMPPYPCPTRTRIFFTREGSCARRFPTTSSTSVLRTSIPARIVSSLRCASS